MSVETDTTALANAIVAYALTFPEAWEDDPWGSTTIKVRKKGFMFSGLNEEEVFTFSVKLKETGLDVLELENAEPTHYGLGKHGWVTLRYEPGSTWDVDEIKGWVDQSYRAAAPKTLVKKLLA